MTAPAPSPIPDRILALDVLRGLAVIGIAGPTAIGLALPRPAVFNPLAYGGVGPADYWVWLASFVFIDGKLRAIFSMLLGAGCLILVERSGGNPWRAHNARMGVLFAIGLVHAVLLGGDDGLEALALAGLALPLFAGLSSQGLFSVALGLVCMHFALGLTAAGPPLVAFHVKHLGSDALLWAERQFGHDAAAIAALLEQGREGWGEQVARRIAGIPGQLKALILAMPVDLAGMALGMGLWQSGMLKGEWRIFRLQRVAGLSALIALPGLLLLSLWLVSEGFAAAPVAAVNLALSAPFDILLALSYAALAMGFVSRETWVCRRIAAAGRLALSNCMLSSALLAAIFAPWGLGLFGDATRSQAFAIGLIPAAGMLLWSPLWLEKLGQGPIERLWRAVTRALS